MRFVFFFKEKLSKISDEVFVMSEQYSADSLSVMHGLDPVRKRPGMYIGSTTTTGLHHLVWEIVDNAVDEATEGFGKKIYVTINADQSMEIEDEGRGIPYDFNKKENLSGFEIVFSTLHGGGKFDGKNYASAGGLHGVGAAVTNALSVYLEVHSYKDGRDHYGRFEKGGDKFSGIKDLGPTSKRGTKVRFLPDPNIFDDTNFDYARIKAHLQDQACLTKGLTFILTDKRTSRKEEIRYDNGIAEYYDRMMVGRDALTKPIHFETTGTTASDIKVDVVFGFFRDTGEERIISFANGVRTTEGGTHVSGFRKALTTCFNASAVSYGKIKATASLDPDCLRKGLVCILSVRVPEKILQFEGQTKTKLGTKDAGPAVDSFVQGLLNYYLVEHKDEALLVLDKTILAMKAKEENEANNRRAREALKRNMTSFNLSDKLTPCSTRDYANNELFIVEGDSAGGSAKKGRNPKHQAILPLRGKPKNTTDVEDEKVLLGNQEISTLIYTIGAGYDSDFKIKDIHYGKVIIMTDADDDGSHIQSLLLTFFYNHMKPLIENGNLYIACPPLYRVYNGKREIYCYDDSELERAKEAIGKGYHVNRYKGLGEMNYSQLGQTTMDPKNRKLLKVCITDDEDATDKIKLFLGRDSDRRKDWIENNIDFTQTDAFTKEVENEK